MSIRFRCAGCQYLLQVPDDAAGKRARCPQCQAVALVPAESENETATAHDPSAAANEPATAPADDEYRLAPGPPPPKPAASENPYQAPSYDYSAPYSTYQVEAAQGPFRPTTVFYESIFRESWQIFQREMGMVIGVVFVVGLVNGVTEGISNFIEEEMQGPEAALLLIGFNFVTWLLCTFLEVGQAIILLKIARGQRADFGELFSGGRFLLRALGGEILFGLAVGIACLLLIVPGIFLALMLWPYFLLIVDRDLGVFESFSAAQQITDGNKGTMFLVFLSCIGIVLLGLLALCVGVIFAGPFVSLVSVVAYLMMTGQYQGKAMPGKTSW